MEYGTSKNFQVLPVHEIAACLGPKARALPIFHALSGCDCNSSPSHCGKLTAWNAWDLVPGLTDTLFAIQEDCTTFTRDSVHMQSLERNYILQYCKSSSCSRVNQARVALFKTTRQDTSYTGCTLTAYKESPSTSRLYLEASSEVPTNPSTVYRMGLEAQHFRSPHTYVVFAF